MVLLHATTWQLAVCISAHIPLPRKAGLHAPTPFLLAMFLQLQPNFSQCSIATAFFFVAAQPCVNFYK